MYERRRQTASPVSLLVVTLLFAWACSSGDHEEGTVTASGGAGFEEAPDNVPRANTAGARAAIGSLKPFGIDAVVGASGAAGDGAAIAVPDPIVPKPAAGGAGGASPGGTAGSGVVMPSAGGAPTAAGAGNSNLAGAGNTTGAAGSPPVIVMPPPVVETACTPEQSASGGDYMPCAVSAALYVCRNCHSNPPVKGVQHPYVTYADVKARSAEIHDLVKSGVMPWPPYKMNDQQKATVVAWLGKDGTCAIGATSTCQ